MPEQNTENNNETSQGNGKSSEKETEEKKQTKESSEEENKAEDDNEDDKEEVKEALALYRDLQKGRKSETLQRMMKESGIDLSKKSVDKIDDSILNIVNKHLGDNYEFLSGQLSSAIEEIVNKKILPEIGKAQSSALEARVENEIGKILNEAKVPKSERENIISEMDSISEQMPMKPNGDLSKYLNNLYNLASRDNQISKRIEKIRKNDADSEQVASETFSDFTVRKGPKNPTLRESVRAADRKEIFEFEDL